MTAAAAALPDHAVDPAIAARLAEVALCARPESRLFMLEVARHLKERWGSRIHLYCSNADGVRFYEAHNRDGLLASITDSAVLLASLDDPDRPVEAEIVARARDYERRIGVTYNLLAVSDRHLGRGFALGGFRHPRSRYSEESDYPALLHAFNRTFEFWEDQISRRGITLVVNGGKEAAVLCRTLGIPFRTLALSRCGNLYYWAVDEFFADPAIERTYREMGGMAVEPVSLDKPYLSHQVMRRRFARELRLAHVVRTMTLEGMRWAWWRLRGRAKARGYYLGERLRHQFGRWRDFRWLRRHARTRLSDLADRRFVFYPLQTEPEASLQRLSPEYFFQLTAIASLARDLPAGVVLAVKETPAAIGRRPRDFYRQIREFKNVVLMDTFELGVEIVREAAVTATISGTAGFEAAVMGRPVIAFGRHNIYGFLPHVREVRGDEDLGEALREALDGSHDAARAAGDGARFHRAVAACSFDMRDYDFLDVARFRPEAVADAAEALAASLQRAPVGDAEAGGEPEGRPPRTPRTASGAIG